MSAAVSCSADGPVLGGVGLGFGSMGKLGCAWLVHGVCAWYVHVVVVVIFEEKKLGFREKHTGKLMAVSYVKQA